jgi:DHA2 family multidrug resistance protein
MLAPSLGPSVGGFVTDHWSWHWLFLINLPPGLATLGLAAATVRIDRPQWPRFGSIDLWALPLLAGFLAGLQLLLKEAPRRGWTSPPILFVAALSLGCGALVVGRSLRHKLPLVDLGAFRSRDFAVGCGYSFVLGAGLYGATYLLPLFLGLVRDYSALPIGEIMIVTGLAQLAMAPVATALERRLDPRLLIGIGYALLALGLAGNGFMTFRTDFWGLFWQQSARGAALLLCLLPSTALALGGFAAAEVANASGIFNLMRNLGGAIALAVIDTVLERRTPAHIAAIVARLEAGDAAAARLVGLPTERFTGVPLGPVDRATRELVAPLVERAGLVAAFNDAWLLLGGVAALSLIALFLLRRPAARAGAGDLPR